jgi:hypothetical protein
VTYVPVKTVSESNRRDHWAVKAKRTKQQRRAAKLLCPTHPLPVVVVLTRIAPHELDDDNLRGALKAIRDGVADRFNTDDRDPRIEWRYAQAKGHPGEFAVRIDLQEAKWTDPSPSPGSAA